MWDDRIDDVARHLTKGEPAADFRDKVLARIDASERPFRWTPLLAAAAAIAALILVAAAVADVKHSHTTAQLTAPLQPAPSPPSPAGTRENAEPKMPDARNDRPKPAEMLARPRPQTPFATDIGSFEPNGQIALESIEFPALTTVEPLTSDPISNDLLTMSAIEITPLGDAALDH